MGSCLDRRSGVPLLAAAVLALALWAAGPFGPRPAAAQPPTATPDQINAVARDLWCPLCNGVRLDNCDLQACAQMRDLIGQKLAAGQSPEQIKAYFVQQYGQVVLGMPSDQGVGRLAWLLPWALVIAGAGWGSYLVATWVRRRAAPAGAGSGPGVDGGRQPRGPADEYLKRVDEELRDDDWNGPSRA